mmetsp:Transcript_20854/g.23234  ORF Transcript_20854/g.23234 Transcript_20854/m.23234 type:complete len:121 (-) Transcript_20854:90-452(-)
MGEMNEFELLIETQKASAMSVFIDEQYIGTQDNHRHEEENIDGRQWLSLPGLQRNYDNIFDQFSDSSTCSNTSSLFAGVWFQTLFDTLRSKSISEYLLLDITWEGERFGETVLNCVGIGT